MRYLRIIRYESGWMYIVLHLLQDSYYNTCKKNNVDELGWQYLLWLSSVVTPDLCCQVSDFLSRFGNFQATFCWKKHPAAVFSEWRRAAALSVDQSASKRKNELSMCTLIPIVCLHWNSFSFVFALNEFTWLFNFFKINFTKVTF